MKVYHVTVVEAGRSKRFVFAGEEEAWACYQAAVQAGFTASAEVVERLYEKLKVEVKMA